MKITCGICGKTIDAKATKTGNPRQPNGWKDFFGVLHCEQCVKARWMLRCITIPVNGPGLSNDETGKKQRDDFWRAIRQCWKHTTALANWTVQQLFKRDTPRRAGDTKMPKMPPVYLYGLAEQEYPDWNWWSKGKARQQANCILNHVQKDYTNFEKRLEVWRGERSIQSYREGYPYTLDYDAIKLSRSEHGTYTLAVRLPGLDWKPALHLHATWEHKRARLVLDKILDGKAKLVESALYECQVNGCGNVPVRIERKNGQSGSSRKRLMAKLVVWLPRPEQTQGLKGVLHVKTAAHCFWESVREDFGAVQAWNANHVSQWIMEYEDRRARFSEEGKRLHRMDKESTQDLGHQREEWAVKHRNRIDTFIHQVTSQLVDHVLTQKVAKVCYHEPVYLWAAFPWHQLKTTLAYKLDGAGIEFEDMNQNAETSGVVVKRARRKNKTQQPPSQGEAA